MSEWRFTFNPEIPSELAEARALYSALRNIRAPGDDVWEAPVPGNQRASSIYYTHRPVASDPDQYRTVLTRFADALGGETLRQERNRRALDQQMDLMQQQMAMYQGPMDPIILDSLAFTAPVATPARANQISVTTSAYANPDVSMDSILEGMRLLHELPTPTPKLDLKLLKTKPRLVPLATNEVQLAPKTKTRFDLIDDFG